MRKKSSAILFLRITGFSIAFLVLMNACKKEDDTSPSASILFTTGKIDSILFLQSNEASQDFRPYQNTDTIRPSSNVTGHSAFFKVRLNSIARSVLGADGKLPPGKSFPDGSIIVKDLYNQKDGQRVLVAIMKKESVNPYSNQGWLWSELLDNGGGYVTAKDKGAQCVGCHNTNSRDFVRVFDLF